MREFIDYIEIELNSDTKGGYFFVREIVVGMLGIVVPIVLPIAVLLVIASIIATVYHMF